MVPEIPLYHLSLGVTTTWTTSLRVSMGLSRVWADTIQPSKPEDATPDQHKLLDAGWQHCLLFKAMLLLLKDTSSNPLLHKQMKNITRHPELKKKKMHTRQLCRANHKDMLDCGWDVQPSRTSKESYWTDDSFLGPTRISTTHCFSCH